jgi:hypothetical protein
MPLVALEIEGRPSPDAGDESLRLRLQVEVARALAAELIQEADHAEQLARRQNHAWPRMTPAGLDGKDRPR